MNIGFKIEDIISKKYGFVFDRLVTFYDDKTGKVEAEYFYLNGKCNYILSWGFPKDSIGEFYKFKSNKVKKPYFSMDKGWYN